MTTLPTPCLQWFVRDKLTSALKKLRQGKGWQDNSSLLKDVPEPLRRQLGIDTTWPAAEQTQRLEELIEDALDHLPDDAKDYVHRAFNRKGQLQADWLDRVTTVAKNELYTSPRTFRREVDDAFALLAAELLASKDPAEKAAAVVEQAGALGEVRSILKYGSGYRTVSLEISIHVRPDEVELRETREVQAREDGIERYALSRNLYWHGTEVTTEATEGAVIERSHWPHDRYMLHLLRFAEPLRAGDRRRFVVTHRTKNMAPIYTTNARETRRLTVRLQLRGVEASAIWVLDRLPIDLLRTERLHDVLHEHVPVVRPDALGLVEHEFEIDEDSSSGVAWELAPADG